MSSIEAPESPMASDDAEQEQPVRGHDRTKIAVGATMVLIVALVIGGVQAQQWMTGLRLFEPPSVGYKAIVPYGGSLFAGGFGVSSPPSEPSPLAQIVIDSAKPVFSANSGPAQVHLLVCKGGLGGGDEAFARKVCSTITNALGKSWRTDGREGQLIAQVKPTSRKAVDFRGFVIKYHQGIRSGTQFTGPEVAATVK
jgi:hypothetical protein